MVNWMFWAVAASSQVEDARRPWGPPRPPPRPSPWYRATPRRRPPARRRAGIQAAQVARGLLDERHEGRVQRKIVIDIVEGGSEHLHVAVAHLLIHQQRRLVGEPRHHARLAGVDPDGAVELHASPVVVLLDGRMRGIQPGGGLEALAFAARSSAIRRCGRPRPAPSS